MNHFYDATQYVIVLVVKILCLNSPSAGNEDLACMYFLPCDYDMHEALSHKCQILHQVLS